MKLALNSSLALGLIFIPANASADDVGKGDGAKKNALVTYNMEDWGGGPDAKDQAHKILKQNFDAAFPKGLRIGKDKKSNDLNSFTFESAEEVRKVLPVRGEPGVMSDSNKEGLKSAGGLAGQLIAAKLNVAFDGMGAMGQTKASGETPLSGRILKGKVAKKLKGMTVRELIAVSDKAISGKFGAKAKASDKIVDLDGDDKPDTTLRALREALNLVNNSYQKGDEMKMVLADPAKGETADEEDDATAEDDASDDDLTDEQEEMLAKIEAEHERQLAELEDSMRADYERAVEAGDREKANLLRERYRLKRATIDAEFEQKKARVEAQVRERRAERHVAPKEGGPVEKGKLGKGGVKGRVGGVEKKVREKGKGDGDDG